MRVRMAGGEGDWMKDDEWIKQRILMHAWLMDTDNPMETDWGRGEGGAAWQWGKGEKVETTAVAQTIKKKK